MAFDPCLVILNARRIPACLRAINRQPIPKVWLTGYTEAQIAKVLPGVITNTAFTHYIVLSDDGEPLRGAVRNLLRHAERHPVVTGWSLLDETESDLVNLTRSPLTKPAPYDANDYDLFTRAQVVEQPPTFQTWFAGMCLTSMTRELWQRFPFGVFDPGSGGYASDYHLSYRLQQAGVPVLAVRDAEVRHHKGRHNKPDMLADRRLIVGHVTPAITLDMPPKPCLGCGRPVRNASRCKACQRPNARDRGYDTRWERTRTTFLATCPVCERCGAPSTEAHHIDGLGPRGPHGHDWENLEALCKSCHSKHTNTTAQRVRL